MSWQSTPTWHVDEATLRAYVDGRPLAVVNLSVEAHLMECPDCRRRLGVLMPREVVDHAWTAIRAHVEAPPCGFAERVVRRLGVTTEAARVLVAVPAFRGGWLLGLFVVTLFAGVAAIFAGEYGMALFLIVAPLAPVAGVAASFGGDADPCHELVTVTPCSATRMLLLRTAGVLATSLPVTLLAGLALPGPVWVGVAWLTPAAAGVALTLLLAPMFGATAASATMAACWSAAVVLATRVDDPIAVVQPAMQLVLILLTGVATAALVLRRTSLERLGRQS
jgi:Putative zinc-finger